MRMVNIIASQFIIHWKARTLRLFWSKAYFNETACFQKIINIKNDFQTAKCLRGSQEILKVRLFLANTSTLLEHGFLDVEHLCHKHSPFSLSGHSSWHPKHLHPDFFDLVTKNFYSIAYFVRPSACLCPYSDTLCLKLKRRSISSCFSKYIEDLKWQDMIFAL